MNTEPTNNLLEGRVILITGAGDGIGRAASISCARHGATVILLGRTTTKLEAVYDEIMATGASEPAIAPMDLASASADDMIELANVIHDNYGRLDGLLHNAAVLGNLIPFETWDMNEWMRVMHVNFMAETLLTRVLIPLLRKSDDARLVFTTSGVGSHPQAYYGAYAVSKSAVEGFARLLAEELGTTSNIRTNLISPGITATKMRATAFPNEDPATLTSPEDLMPLYLYVLGPDSREENGRTFTPESLNLVGH